MSESKSGRPLTRRMWEQVLSRQERIAPDQRFPDRPDSEDFQLISRIARALDVIGETIADAVPQVAELLGARIESLEYMARGRIRNAMALIRRSEAAGVPRSMDAVLSRRLQAAWIDGWMHGALYLAETGPLKEALDA